MDNKTLTVMCHWEYSQTISSRFSHDKSQLHALAKQSRLPKYVLSTDVA